MAIGVEALRHLHGRREYAVIAAMPLVLGAHQIDETFVWWSLQGHVAHGVGTVAMWIYLTFALVVLPTLVPLVVLGLERTAARRWRIAPFAVIGLATSSILLEAMVATPPRATLGSYHIAYSIGLQHGIAIVGLYIVATCGAALASSSRDIRWFGAANVVAVIVLARLCADGFTSLWCFYAALLSAAIALHLRFSSRRPAPRGVLVEPSSARG